MLANPYQSAMAFGGEVLSMAHRDANQPLVRILRDPRIKAAP
jgi:hypothetical protein